MFNIIEDLRWRGLVKDYSNEKEVEELLKECMMSAAELKTTLISETGVGDSWYDAH